MATKQKQQNTLAEALKEINKGQGAGTLMMMDELDLEVERIPCGILSVDLALGGGFPRGRICEQYGGEGCLDGDTFVQYSTRAPTSGKEGANGPTTLEALYHTFNQTSSYDYYATCVGQDGGIFRNRIIDVVKTGTKECYQVTSDGGEKLIATKDHRFFSEGSFFPLSELSIGRVITVEREGSTVDAHILSIEPVGMRETYDIKMQSPDNNYIANGFVVHNSGKTSLSLMLAAEVQRRGDKVAYLDVENGMDENMVKAYGVDIKSMAYSPGGSGEDVFKMLEILVQTDDTGLVIVDSVAAMTPRAEVLGDYGDSHVGLQARMMGQGLRKLSTTMADCNSRVIVLFINQLRSTIGPFGGDITPGGRALKFWASVRLDVKRTGQLKPQAGEDPPGHSVKIKTTKNRTAPPLRTATFDMLYDRGLSNGSSVLDLGLKLGVVDLAGSWYKEAATAEAIGQGRLAAIDKIEEDQELCDRLSEQITALYRGE